MWQQMFDRLLYRYCHNGQVVPLGHISPRPGQDNVRQEGLYELRMAFTPY